MAEITKPPQLAGRGGVWFDRRRRGAPQRGPRLPARGPGPSGVRRRRSARVACPIGEAGIDITADDSASPVERCYVTDPFGNRIELVAAADAGFSLS
jgi:hypothetical protein